MISHVLHGSLLKKRLEILNVFIHFENMVENQLSPKIKILRTYGLFFFGGGWFSSIFFFYGIIHYLPCPHTPQQKGISKKRKHRHMVKSGLSMILKSWFTSYMLALCLLHLNPPYKLTTLHSFAICVPMGKIVSA